MTIGPEEIGAFVAGADAVLINLGTFDIERRSAIDVAVAYRSTLRARAEAS
jgi:hydroxyethylthiazole kinase